MLKLGVYFLLGLSCAFMQPVFAQVPDIFTGTILLEGEQTKLVRCDLVSNTYTLQNAENSKEDFLDILRKKAITGEKFHVSLTAIYKEIDGQNFLQVSEIFDALPGSCHLKDVFGGLED